MSLPMCQTRHAKREVWGSWEATELQICVSKSASGFSEAYFSENLGFRWLWIRIRCALLGGIVVEASLDVVFVV